MADQRLNPAKLTRASDMMFSWIAIAVIIVAYPIAAYSSSEAFALAVMRTDGVLIPIAQYSQGKFKNFWPEYDEISNMDMIMPDELSGEWFENRLPTLREWFYMGFEGEKKRIALSKKTNDLRCDDTWGIDTDHDKKPYECQICCPYPKIGIASDRNLDWSPVVKVDLSGRFSEYFKSLYGADMVVRLDKILKEKDEFSRKTTPSDEERILLENNRASIFKISHKEAKYFYEIVLVHTLKEYNKGCPEFDVYQGWFWDDAGELKTIFTKATRTDCDFMGSELLTPHVSFIFDGKTYVIAEESGYESETWTVYEVGESEIKAVASALIHAL